MAFKQVGKFTLNQQGGYVSRVEFNYINDDGSHGISQQTDNQLVDQTYTIDPGKLGVPDGAFVTLHLWVMAGYDEDASQSFIYSSGGSGTAVYMCNGTTLIGGKLHFQGVTS